MDESAVGIVRERLACDGSGGDRSIVARVPAVKRKAQPARLTVPVHTDRPGGVERPVGCESLTHRRAGGTESDRRVLALVLVQEHVVSVLAARGGEPCVDRAVVMDHDRWAVPVTAAAVDIPAVGDLGYVCRSLADGDFTLQFAVQVAKQDNRFAHVRRLVRLHFERQSVNDRFRAVGGKNPRSDGVGYHHRVFDVLLHGRIDRGSDAGNVETGRIDGQHALFDLGDGHFAAGRTGRDDDFGRPLAVRVVGPQRPDRQLQLRSGLTPGRGDRAPFGGLRVRQRGGPVDRGPERDVLLAACRSRQRDGRCFQLDGGIGSGRVFVSASG